MKKNIILFSLFSCLINTSFAAPTAEQLLAADPPRYIVQSNGKRLNSFISRDIEILVKAYERTRDKKYFDGVVRYMKAAALYPDWRAKEHYLSASYIVRAFGIALESCGDEMPADVRIDLEDALLKKGLEPAENHPFWQSNDNWTQACSAAVARGAYALRKRFPVESERLLKRCIESTKEALKAYAPDGCFAEGPSFWKFATEKTDEFIAFLKEKFGDDYGIGASIGYAKSHEWMKSILGHTGKLFNYGDGDSIAHQGEKRNFNGVATSLFDGVQPTGVIASEKVFLAMKGGKANSKHAHMDAGSFVVETLSDGQAIRWVEDLGSERVRRIEHAKIDIDNFGQDSTRWSVFRYGPFAHSTFHIDGKLHLVDGFVKLEQINGNSIVADCSALYDGVWGSAKRVFSVLENGNVKVEDAFVEVKKGHLYTFNFCTSAKVNVEDGFVVLEKDNQRVTVRPTVKGVWTSQDIARPKHSYESPNRGMKKVNFAVELPEGDCTVGFYWSR